MTCATAFRPAFTPLTIALMVLGFVIFWPFGLAMLAYIFWGDRFKAMRHEAHKRRAARRYRAWARGDRAEAPAPKVAPVEAGEWVEPRSEHRFDDGRAAFDAFLNTLRHGKDREEFDRFMARNRRKEPGAA